MKITSFLLNGLVIILLFFSCQNTGEIETQTTEKQEKKSETKTAVVTKPSELFAKYFSSEEQEVLLKIKAFYEEGIFDGFTFDKLGEAYEYNAGVIRTDLFNKIPHTLTFPYNGKFALSMFEKDVPKLSFITKKCGFQDAKTEKIINYYCPNLDENFFAFLDAAKENSSLIQNFHEDYLNQKVISNQLKESMILQSSEDLDFDNFNHQLFYMLFHVFVNEEQKAMAKVK